MPASVLLVAPIVTVFAPAPSAAKLAPVYWPITSSKVPPLMVPNSNVRVPLPIALLVLVWPSATSFCACASCVTSSE